MTGSGFRFIAAAIIGGATVVGCSSSNTTSTTPTASSIAVISGNAQAGTVGMAAAAPLVVKVDDQNGNALSGVPVTFTASGGASLSATSATTDANGEATVNLTLLGTHAGTDTVLASISGVTTNATFIFTANAGAAAEVTIVSGNNQSATAGTALAAPLVVQVTDQYGNDVGAATVDWTTSAGSIAGTTQSVTNSSGMASAILDLPAVAGQVTVTATIDATVIATMFTETAM